MGQKSSVPVVWVGIWINNYQNDQLWWGSKGLTWVPPEKGRPEFKGGKKFFISSCMSFSFSEHALPGRECYFIGQEALPATCPPRLLFWVRHSQEGQWSSWHGIWATLSSQCSLFIVLFFFLFFFLLPWIPVTHILLDFNYLFNHPSLLDFE